jgi:hypothetical protein
MGCNGIRLCVACATFLPRDERVHRSCLTCRATRPRYEELGYVSPGSVAALNAVDIPGSGGVQPVMAVGEQAEGCLVADLAGAELLIVGALGPGAR